MLKKSATQIPTLTDGSRRHDFHAFTDGECEIPDMLLCVKKKQFKAQEETLALYGMQRYLGGPLCTNYIKIACPVVCSSKAAMARQLASASYTFWDSVVCIWPRAS